MNIEITALVLEVLLGFVLLLIATVAFDVIHVLLHTFYNSNNKVLKRIGYLHEVHHEFLDTELKIHEDKISANVYCHVIPEYITQVVVTALFIFVFPLTSVIAALLLETFIFALIMKGTPGFDVNHRYVDRLLAYRPLFFCLPEYHLLHHVYPNAYYSSWIKLLDYILGSGIYLKKRKVLMTDNKLPFGQEMEVLLKKEGCHVELLAADSDKKTKQEAMEKAEILLLCHKPDKDSGYDEFATQFCEVHKDRHTPVELWALTSSEELSAAADYDDEFCMQKAFLPKARSLFDSEALIYRHLVASGSNTERKNVASILKKIKRGYNYVTENLALTHTVHFLRFLLYRKSSEG